MLPLKLKIALENEFHLLGRDLQMNCSFKHFPIHTRSKTKWEKVVTYVQLCTLSDNPQPDFEGICTNLFQMVVQHSKCRLPAYQTAPAADNITSNYISVEIKVTQGQLSSAKEVWAW